MKQSKAKRCVFKRAGLDKAQGAPNPPVFHRFLSWRALVVADHDPATRLSNRQSVCTLAALRTCKHSADSSQPLRKAGLSQSSNTALAPLKLEATMTTRLVWLRPAGSEQAQNMSLLSQLAATGLAIWIIEVSNLNNLVIEDVTDFDLILFEYAAPVLGELKTVVRRIRSDSRAPLLMLTDDHSVARSLEALSVGADAILASSTPDEVIVARCNALLRRWLANSGQI